MSEQTLAPTNTVITKPVEGWPADGRIWTSVAVANNSSSFDAVRATVQYGPITPDGKDVRVGFILQAVLEEEISSNIWVPVATQFDVIKGTDEATTQIIEYSPALNFDRGIAEKIFAGNQEVASISRTQGNLGPKFRLVILRTTIDPDAPELESLTFGAYVRRFNLSA